MGPMKAEKFDQTLGVLMSVDIFFVKESDISRYAHTAS